MPQKQEIKSFFAVLYGWQQFLSNDNATCSLSYVCSAKRDSTACTRKHFMLEFGEHI